MRRRALLSAHKGLHLLNYIESSGTQYIDSGFCPTTNSRMVLDFQPMIAEAKCYAGCRTGTKSGAFTINSGSSGRFQYVAYADSGNVMLGNLAFDRQTISISKDEFVQNGVVTPVPVTTQLTGTYSIYLFACNNDGVTLQSSCRIFSCKIYDNDVLVRYFIPVLDKYGIACMYDKVSGEFFYNNGSGTFLYG